MTSGRGRGTPARCPTRPTVIAPPPGPPQVSPRCEKRVENRSEHSRSKWNPSDHRKGISKLSEADWWTRDISAGARARADGLSDHANILDAGLAQFVHNRGEAAEGHGFVAAEEDGVGLRVAHTRLNQLADFVDVHRLVAEIDALGPVNGDHQAVLADLLHGLG